MAGNSLIDSTRPQVEHRPWIGRRARLADLRAAASKIVPLYARDRWLARCDLPPQDVTEGLVRLQIVVVRFGGVRLEGHSRRVDTEHLRRLVEA